MSAKPNSVVTAGGAESQAKFGNGLPLALIAGPCALESRAHAFEMAAALEGDHRGLGLGLVYKTSFDKANRTSAASARGIGLDKALRDVRGSARKARRAGPHRRARGRPVRARGGGGRHAADPGVFVPADRSLVAAAETGRVVNVKKGQFLAPWDMANVVAKITGAGNPNVLVTERGASFGYNTLVSDMRALPVLAKIGAPVIFDATHSVQQPGGQGTSSGGERAIRAGVGPRRGRGRRRRRFHRDPSGSRQGAVRRPEHVAAQGLGCIARAIDAIRRAGEK